MPKVFRERKFASPPLSSPASAPGLDQKPPSFQKAGAQANSESTDIQADKEEQVKSEGALLVELARRAACLAHRAQAAVASNSQLPPE